jgi:hypothetical protein
MDSVSSSSIREVVRGCVIDVPSVKKYCSPLWVHKGIRGICGV